MYLHELGDTEASFTKEDMQQGYIHNVHVHVVLSFCSHFSGNIKIMRLLHWNHSQ